MVEGEAARRGGELKPVVGGEKTRNRKKGEELKDSEEGATFCRGLCGGKRLGVRRSKSTGEGKGGNRNCQGCFEREEGKKGRIQERENLVPRGLDMMLRQERGISEEASSLRSRGREKCRRKKRMEGR